MHHLRRDARICVVGLGRGARHPGGQGSSARSTIVAVEINADILDVVNGRFGDYTGHLDRDPIVRLRQRRSAQLSRALEERFDIVQVTFIDTWAATAAGAYTLTENSLYTVEGWKTFLDRVEDNGLLAVSRGIGPELARLVVARTRALLASGVTQPGAAHGAGHQSPRQARRLVRSRWACCWCARRRFRRSELAQVRASRGAACGSTWTSSPGAPQSALLRVLATGHVARTL